MSTSSVHDTAGEQPGDLPLDGSIRSTTAVSIGEAFWVWCKIGLLSFGGPAGQIALMHRIVVDEKKWIGEKQFLHALNFCMILPGPEAQQLATYTGWLLHGIRGGLLAGTLFVLPGFFVILGLSSLYVAAGHLPLIQGLFLGFKAAVIAIVLQALVRISRRALVGTPLIGLATLAFVAMFFFGIPFPYIVVVSFAIGLATARFVATTSPTEVEPSSVGGQLECESYSGSGREASTGWRYALRIATVFGFLWLAPVALLYLVLGGADVFATIGLFFSKMAVVTFGGAYAVLAYVAQEAVQVHRWLTPLEMIDGLAMAETTPGPLILVVQFVGFLAAYRNPGAMAPWLAGFLASALTLWVTFVPCFLWIFLGAPHIERLRNNRWLRFALMAVTASVVGVIANLAVWFTMHALFAQVARMNIGGLMIDSPVWSSMQPATLFITVVAIVLTFRMKASIVITLAVAGMLGIVWGLVGG